MLRPKLTDHLWVFILIAACIAHAEEPSRSVLYIGDSISYGRFGEEIDTALREISSRVVTETSCGSAPINWLPQTGPHAARYSQTICGFWKKTQAKDLPGDRSVEHSTPQLLQELDDLHPAVTIVQLGTNIASRKNPEVFRETVRMMMADILAHGSQCIWIGPPDANSTVVPRNRLSITNRMIQEEATAQGCAFIDTLSFTHFPGETPACCGEGIHPSPDQSKRWGDEVAQRVVPLVTKIMGTNHN